MAYTAPRSEFDEMSFKDIPQRLSQNTSTAIMHSNQDTMTLPVNADYDQESTTFAGRMQDYQIQLDAEYQQFEGDLKDRAHETTFPEMDWTQLETLYTNEIYPKTAAEREIMDDMATHFKYFLMWMQASTDRESERAIKRLRTRMAFVQTSESAFVEKQAHHQKVLDAFRSAMALFGNL